MLDRGAWFEAVSPSSKHAVVPEPFLGGDRNRSCSVIEVFGNDPFRCLPVVERYPISINSDLSYGGLYCASMIRSLFKQ